MIDERLERIRDLDEQYVMQTYRRLPVAFVRGSGSWLYDTSGNKYLDMVSGLGAVPLGHCHPHVTDAIKRQAETLIHTTNLYYIEPQTDLARMIIDNAFPGKCFFANSGAEANEGALKLCRKYHFLKGKPRTKFVCAFGSFHGRTLATLSAAGQPHKWDPFQPLVQGFTHVPYNDINALEREVDSETCALFLEPIQGESGIYPATKEYLKAAREICDSTGALLVLDEVQTGLARTGRMFAHQHYEIVPDVMTLAKGLGNGVPIGVVVASERCSDVLGLGDHGSTFGGGFLACVAGITTLKCIIEEKIIDNVCEVSKFVKGKLEMLSADVPLVTGVRGYGLMLAVQLELEISREVVLECLKRGILVNDVNSSSVRLLPPLNISLEEISHGLRIFMEVLKDFSHADNR